jgi:hypothetical protein
MQRKTQGAELRQNGPHPREKDLSMNAVARPALLETSSQGVAAKLAAAKYHLAALLVAALVALVATFGYALVISLGLLATFAGLAMLVGLTAIDLMAQPRRKRAVRRMR